MQVWEQVYALFVGACSWTDSSWIVTGPWEGGSDSQRLLPPAFINETIRTNIIEAEKKCGPHRII